MADDQDEPEEQVRIAAEIGTWQEKLLDETLVGKVTG